MQPNWQQQQQLQGGYYNPQQQQPQQPQQTGFGLQSQPTGFPSQQRPQPTGLPSGNLSFLNAPPPSFGGGGMGGGMAPQMTGYPGGGASGLMSQQTGYGGMGMGGMRPQQTGFGGGMMSQPTGMMSQPTGMMGQPTGLMSQPTGMGGLRAQPTGYQDPRLQSMMQSFMPSNMSQPFTSSGVPQFNQAPQNQPLAHTFQSLIQNPSVKTPKVPWTLTKQEKKDYDQIFRAWEKGDGFVSGETAREVFGQSGLSQDDMIKIWTLSDVDNRGKLNLPEFHVAMGLIYRALNGNEIPDKLPEEMVPPSMRDIDTTVNFMRDLLKHESSTRSTASSPGYGSASFANQSKDATAYKHDDTRSSSAYKPSSRHLDRKSVRYAGEESGAEIGDIRRQLQNTSALLDKSNSEYERKTEEDERLEQEVDDLKYRVKRLQEDIDYVSKGRRSAEKDEERRKLERELLFLMHEKLPELERRQEQREEEKRREERAGVRARDRRNDTHGRYDDRDREKDDHAWLKGSYDRDRRDSRDSYRRDERDRDYGRRDSRDRDYDRGSRRDGSRDREYRPRSPPASRTPPPAPPPPVASAPAPPAPPKPTKTPDVPNTKNMTPEERTAFIREQAQRRIQERLRALGVESASETPVVDKSVEERLAQEKKEAEEKSRSADEEQKAREQARQARLAGTTTKEEPKEDVNASPEAPKGILKGKTGPPPPPTSRAKQPPKPPAPRASAAPPAPAPPAQQSEPEDEEEAEFRRREEAIKKAKEDRRRRLEQLEREEEEERQREASAAGGISKSPEIAAPVPIPAAPPAPPAASTAPSTGGYNPFRKPGAGAAAPPSVKSPPPPAVPSPGGFNPFFKPQAAKDASAGSTPITSPPAAPAPPPPPPAPPAPPPPAQAPVRSPPLADDGWESIHEKEAESDSDSSDDDDYAKSRDNRRNLASALFGGLGGGSNSSPTTSRPGSAAPKPAAALKNLGGGDPSAGRGALLSAIAGGARLKKTQTVVKGGPVAGKVIGDAEPPAHINAAPVERQRSPSPPPAPETNADGFEEDFQPRNANRQSVDWYAGLAADQTHPSAGYEPLEATREEAADTPAAAPENKQEAEEDELADFDLTTSIRVRTLFPYEGQRDVDLSFNENMVVIAHPAKDSSSPWWYGLLVDGGNKGWFPHDYVTEMQHVKAKALYSYAGSTPEELPFAEGDELVIVDQSEADWWKVEKAGVIFIVPASYLEIQDPRARSGEVAENVGGITDAAPNAGGPVVVQGRENIQAGRQAPQRGPTQAQASVSLDDEPVLDMQGAPAVPPEVAARATPGASLNNSTDSFPSTVLLSPTIPSHVRPRSSTMASFTSSVDDGESSDDSVLSWWSDSDEDSDDEGQEREVDEEKEAERKRREEERLKMLSVAGLQLRREPPKPPVTGGGTSGREGGGEAKSKPRRAAPAAPKRRRRAPAVPVTGQAAGGPGANKEVPSGGDPDGHDEVDTSPAEKLDTQDAYARYEQFLAESRNRPALIPTAPSPRPPPATLPGPSGSRPSSAVFSESALSPTTSTLSASMTGSTSGGGGGGGRLSGFFSKMMQNTASSSGTGESGRPRRSTIISGPITRVEDSGRSTPMAGEASPGLGSSAADPELGKTWGSMVDSGILASMSDKERKRQESIFEFIATESAYNRDLQLIVQIFYAGLLDTLDEKAQTVIFANVEDILLANTAFLSDLEERQRETRLYVDRVGDVVRSHMGDMGVYTTYCVNQSQAGQLLQSLRSSDPALSSKLDGIRESNSAVRGLDLSHFLLIPMQRITRYPLLLKQIIHYTDDDQDLPLLQDALITVENIVSRINESVRENESRERLRILSEDLWIGGEGRLDLTAPTAYQGPRRLIKEGTVMKAKSGRKLTLVLCNDILVLIDSRNLYRMPIPLFECTVRSARDELGFTLKVEYRKGGDTIGLKALSARDAKEWRWLIEEARLKAVDARMASGTGGMRGF